MATSTITQKSKALRIYNNDESTYMHIQENATQTNRMDVSCKKTVDDTAANMYMHFPDGLSYVHSGVTKSIGAAINDNTNDIATNATDILANTASITANGVSIATNAAGLASEISNRAAAITALTGTVDANMVANGILIGDVAADLVTETAARVAGDSTLSDNLNAVSNNLTTETTDRTAADLTLTNGLASAVADIATEITNRITAVAGVQTQLDGIFSGSSDGLNSFIEVVNDYNANGATIQANLDAQIAAHVADEAVINGRLDAIEAAIAELQAS